MKKAIFNLTSLAKKSFGLSVLLLFIMFASVHAQNVEKDNARVDTLITKICKSVPGLKGIATATLADVQTLSDYASIGLKYRVYSTEFQKIQTACQSTGINILPVDRLLPYDEKKMVGKIAFVVYDDVINSILKEAGISGGNFDKATIPQIKAAIAKAQDEKKDMEGAASRESGYKKSLLMLVANKLGIFIVIGTSKIESLELDAQVAQSQAEVKATKARIDKLDVENKATKAELDKMDVENKALAYDVAKLVHRKDSLAIVLKNVQAEAEAATRIAKSLEVPPK